ncbi:MAG: class I SAM-dependent methyltransferase [Nostocaceae cyanobacterium]|nr:class I SAM-dependent methyltransferase [Nostocaceae cyanobacterium]
MQLRLIFRLLVLSVGVGSLMLIGCTQENTSNPTDKTQASSPTSVAETTPQPSPPTPVPTTPATPTPNQAPDVVYVPTPQVVVNKMLELAKVTKDDVIYDLGSGDGRIVITAAQKFSARKGVGIEIDPKLVKQSQENAKTAGVSDRVDFRQQDLFTTDLREATVVTLYLLPELNVKLRPKLFKELKPGTRIVSHDFDMGDWKPEKVVKVKGDAREHTVYFWTIPQQVPENLR